MRTTRVRQPLPTGSSLADSTGECSGASRVLRRAAARAGVARPRILPGVDAIVARHAPLPLRWPHPVPRPKDARPRRPGAAADPALLRPPRPARRAAERGGVEARHPGRGLERRGGHRRRPQPGGPNPQAHAGRRSAGADVHPYGAAPRLPLRLRRRRGAGRGAAGACTGRRGARAGGGAGVGRESVRAAGADSGDRDRCEHLLRRGPGSAARRRCRRRRSGGGPAEAGGRDPA